MADNKDIDTQIALTQHALAIADLKANMSELSTRTLVLEKILIIGDGDRKPLVQVMRDMETRLNEFFDAQKEGAKEAKEEKKWLRRTIITSLLGIFFTVVLPFLWQAFVFWKEIVPALDKLVQSTP